MHQVFESPGELRIWLERQQRGYAELAQGMWQVFVHSIPELAAVSVPLLREAGGIRVPAINNLQHLVSKAEIFLPSSSAGLNNCWLGG